MGKYVYVVESAIKYVTQVSLTDKTAIEFCEYDAGDIDIGMCYTWDKNNELLDCGEIFDFAEKEQIISGFGDNVDMVIPSDLTLKEICELINNSQYLNWNSEWSSCYPMLCEYSKLVTCISIEELANII